MSGTFNFEALMFYFRLNMIGIPIVLYQTASILLNFQRYKAQLEGIYN